MKTMEETNQDLQLLKNERESRRVMAKELAHEIDWALRNLFLRTGISYYCTHEEDNMISLVIDGLKYGVQITKMID